MTGKQPDLNDINAMAIEACDMWQEHLSNFSKDPSMRAELTRFLEPQRRLFADWAAMMQKGASHGPASANEESSNEAAATSDAPSEPTKQADGNGSAGPAAASPAAAGVAAHGDDPFRVAQLALRLAELEKRVAKLESLAPGASR